MNKNRIFQIDHKLIAYYTSARTLHHIEKALKNGNIDMHWQCYRYHILLIIQTVLRKIKGIKSIPAPNSKDMNELCEGILSIIDNEKHFDIVASVNHMDTILKDDRFYRKHQNGSGRTKEFTLALLANVDKTISEFNKIYQ